MSWLNKLMNWVEGVGAEINDNIIMLAHDKFNPHVHLPTQNPTATPMTITQQIYEIASHYNSAETKVYYPNRNDSSGTLDAYIGHNDSATNQLVAETIVASAETSGLNVFFLASVIMQESQFSPVTFNHNLSQEHLVPDFAHTDWGISQFSGSFLPSKPGMAGLTEEEMQAKAQDATWAIPVMANVYAGLINEASKNLSTNTALASAVHSLNSTEYTDAQFLGSLSYNRGYSGALKYINEYATANNELNELDLTDDEKTQALANKNNALSFMKHPYRCANWYSQFVSYAKTAVFVSAKSLGIEDESEHFTDHEAR